MQNTNANNIVLHTIQPIFDKNSKILILGTIPSPKSRETGFYYSHPQNRFWQVMAFIFNMDIPKTVDEKINFLLKNKIALWDVLQSCKIKNAADNSISDYVVNDLPRIFNNSNVRTVFTTGKKATTIYNKHFSQSNGFLPAIYLPSTSPANCAMNFERLTEYFGIVLKYLYRNST